MLILLPVDGSALALAAVRHAVALTGAGLRATFLLVNVQKPANLYEVMIAPNSESIDAASAEAGVHLLAEAERLLAAAGASYERIVAHGEPAETLLALAEARAVDAIVLGTHAVGALQGALLGSVSQQVIHGAGVPVTVVKVEDVDTDTDTDLDAADAR